MKLIRASIALVAFAAIIVVPSMASAASPTLCETVGGTCNNVAVGTQVLATNVAHSNTVTETVMTTALGDIKCTNATITGEVEKNTGGHVVGTISTVEFRRTAGKLANEAHCSGPGGLGTITVTPNHTSDKLHNGIASLPWCITAAGLQNQFIVYGKVEGSCLNGKTRPLTFTLHSSVLGACSYEKAQVEGTYTTHPSDAVLTIHDEEFKKITGSGFCPVSGKLDMAFTLATDEKEVSGAPLYIK
jgi:hypothetical protein